MGKVQPSAKDQVAVDPKKLRSTVRQDQRGIFIWTNGAKHRPGGIVGYDHAYDMSDAGLKVGDHVWARHISQTTLARVTTADGTTVVWANDYEHERANRQGSYSPPTALRGVQLAQFLVQGRWAELEMRTMTYMVTEFCRHRGLDLNTVMLQDEIMWPSSEMHEEFKAFCRQLTQRIAAFTEV